MHMPPGSGLRSRDPLTSHGGGRGDIPVDYDWGGGDHRGGGDDDSVPSYPDRLKKARLAVYIVLASIIMLFVGFSTLMLIRKSGTRYDTNTSNYVSDWTPVPLPVDLLLFNTFLLVLSSVSLEYARKQARRRVALYGLHVPGVSLGREFAFPWLATTLLLGAGFLVGQYRAWELLHHHGLYLGTLISSSFFFILTGAHAAHLIAGMTALAYAGAIAAFRRAPENYRLVIDATSVFWHFMGVLWIYLFALMYFGGA
jgi:cytochrome c oxidase subunit 3